MDYLAEIRCKLDAEDRTELNFGIGSEVGVIHCMCLDQKEFGTSMLNSNIDEEEIFTY